MQRRQVAGDRKHKVRATADGLRHGGGDDTRYQTAEEYIERVDKLWEDSREDGAVLRHRARGILPIPRKCIIKD
jgi:alkanesulfonate monooxygenase SsuD/methylene tetrahydromethanopterin reductase-like flavin-dependent oxidoreductase (luciferase family)